jgi:hypothetical protein
MVHMWFSLPRLSLNHQLSLLHSSSIRSWGSNTIPLLPAWTYNLLPNQNRPWILTQLLKRMCCFFQGCWANRKGSSIYPCPSLVPCDGGLWGESRHQGYWRLQTESTMVLKALFELLFLAMPENSPWFNLYVIKSKAIICEQKMETLSCLHQTKMSW